MDKCQDCPIVQLVRNHYNAVVKEFEAWEEGHTSVEREDAALEVVRTRREMFTGVRCRPLDSDMR